MEDFWLSTNDICKKLRVRRNTVYRWISKYGMPAHRIGRFWKFQKDELDLWIELNSTLSLQQGKQTAKKKTYSLSFTTGDLLFRDSLVVANLFLDIRDWKLVREKIVTKNLLQAKTLSTTKRICGEVCSRLKMLSQSELELLAETTLQEQGYLLWLAICRRYKFVAEFAMEVLRERYLSLKNSLNHEDFNFFFSKKLELHQELAKVSQRTVDKSRQILFRIIRQAGLLTTDNQISAALLSPRLLNELADNTPLDILVFPYLAFSS
nr:BrxA family protein [Pseudanabaena sp. SR411]